MTKHATKSAGSIITVAMDDDERREFWLHSDQLEQQVSQRKCDIKYAAISYLQNRCGITMRANANKDIVIEALFLQCLKMAKRFIWSDGELDRVARALVELESSTDLE